MAQGAVGGGLVALVLVGLSWKEHGSAEMSHIEDLLDQVCCLWFVETLARI